MAKNSKLDLFEKIPALKAWQSKQQEILLAQEKEQQNMLKRQTDSKKQFGFRKPEGLENQSSVNGDQMNNSEDRQKTGFRGPAESREESNMDNKSNRFFKENESGNVSLDELPVKSAKMGFEELLEGKINEMDDGLHGRHESRINERPKREFLRKGEGLKRFRMNSQNEFLKTQSSNVCNKAQKCVKKKLLNVKSSAQNRITTNSCTRAPNDQSKGDGVVPIIKQDGKGSDLRSCNSESGTWAHVLTQEHRGAPPKSEKLRKHEAEDLKVFEILEQMAVDSSFCSTSSTLLGFMESPIISTPLKAILEQRENLKALKSTKQLPFGMDSSDGESSSQDFNSSSDSCYSETENTSGKIGSSALSQGTSRVRFSSHVEEREFDPGIGKLTLKGSSSAGQQFKDTEAWSDSEDDSNDEESTAIPVVDNKSTDSTPDVEKNETKSTRLLGKEETNCSNISSGDEYSNNSSEIILKSELLHRRLLELEREIETFRKENEELAHRKQLQQQAEKQWSKEKSEIEKQLKEKEDKLKSAALEERQKLSREKKVFETYSRKLNNKPSNQQEVETLQQKLAELQQELRDKERRNAAAHSRINNRVKVLEKENSELKEEIEKLKKEKQAEFKKLSCRLGNRKKTFNTRAVHQINEQLTRIPVIDTATVSKVEVSTKAKSLQKEELPKRGSNNRNSEGLEKDTVVGVSLRRIQSVPDLLHKPYSVEDCASESDESGGEDCRAQSGRGATKVPLSDASELRDKTESRRPLLGSSCEAANPSMDKLPQVPSASTAFPLEKRNPDGSLEIRYENGNFKHVSPDGLNAKLFYFNGDVKETLSDGTIKYYYSETRTWHTTFPDGLEILEFPNGQVERHLKEMVEVAFADGTLRIIHGDGREELRLSDGTTAITEANGDKVILLPNGQKEYQTNDYKKRVYPDGTVKIIYSDGVQETRYSNGRVRLRDSTGSLLMDSEC